MARAAGPPALLTVGAVIERLLPFGTEYELTDGRLVPSTRSARRSWETVPTWPPDLFAVAATLVDLSSSYCHVPAADWSSDAKFAGEVRRLGQQWSGSSAEDGWFNALQEPWTELWRRHRDEPVVWHGRGRPPGWWAPVHKLLAVSDEAAAGFGFTAEQPDNPLWIYVLQRALSASFPAKPRLRSRVRRRSNSPTATLCELVPAEIACVQPKCHVPQVGCTLRSLSHHLALLPGIGQVHTRWHVGQREPAQERSGALRNTPLNVLLVPYPYAINGDCFRVEHVEADERWGYFGLKQRWLERSRRGIEKFLLDLVKVARQEVSEVHGVVLPELALDHELAARIARRLAAEYDVEFFVTGVSGREPPRNEAFSCVFEEWRPGARARRPIPWQQSKHHRWKLNRSQIARYHLGHALDPQFEWWEGIRLLGRAITLYEVRRGASMAVLICEDLARIDPVQPAIRAIGPNLVVALLMDGAQLERRWPGRYATVLADDPGSAVLTLTSLGMVLRSALPGETPNRSVALWKDGTGDARALPLRSGAHALLLTLSSDLVEERTLDRRSDDGATVQFFLSGVRDVIHPKPPAWART